MATAEDLDRATDSSWDWVAQQTRLYLDSGGTKGHENDGVRMLVLATTGRHSGTPRRTCLIYGSTEAGFVVVGSKAGEDDDPDWFKNLVAESQVGVQVGPRRFTGHARVATAEEREPLWQQMLAIFPLYGDYEQRTTRTIPIVVISPDEHDPSRGTS